MKITCEIFCLEGESMQTALERYDMISKEERFRGWALASEPVLGAKIPYFGQVLEYDLKTGNGVEHYASIIRHFGWAEVFGVTTDNQVITLVQWKPGVNAASWELPPGGIGKIGSSASMEEILRTTQEIFTKETGYGKGKYQYLGNILIETGKYRGAGPNDHGLPAHMFLATGIEKIADARCPAPNEIMETLLVPFDEFEDVIDSGLFREESALSCALLALRRLKKIKQQKKE